MSPPADSYADRSPVAAELVERVGWFIRLRWVAAAAMIVGPLVARRLLGLAVPVAPVQATGAAVALGNAVFRVAAPAVAVDDAGRPGRLHRFASLQILADWAALAMLVHWTGGVVSPLLFFVFLHVIIACLLLPARVAFLHAAVIIALVSVVAGLEAVGVLGHHALSPLLPDDLFRNPVFAVGQVAALAVAVFAATGLGTAVARGLRAKDVLLVDAERATRDAYRRLEEADRRRNEFVRKVTHELRAPLNGAEAMMSLLTDGYVGETSEQRSELFARIRARIAHLRAMVNDLLDLARGETSVQLRPRMQVDVVPVFDEQLRKHRPEAEAHGLTLEGSMPDEPVILYADPRDIEGITGNLLTNAIKYTPTGGRVRFDVEVAADVLAIRVEDSGIGIPAEDVERLFQEFFRAGNARELTIEGTGLGLVIVKRMVERYDGQITVDSEPGRGTTFLVRIPLPYCRIAPPGAD